ncbi:coiled coil domain containing protein Alhambra isoform X1 [Dermacentor variabilis]|uniref:coiled coil domain containing protein Alhambra isoform X1 n=1 Tax=Dermacentor variabilis TaxID=34621 RepID=UPI003F5B2D54
MKEMVGGCCVCSDERGWAENPLVYCDGQGCTVAVHQACYGIVQVPTGPWFCRKCESQERCARVRCELCPSRDGALKRTDNGGWAHVVCALYIPEVRFGNVTTMEPIVLQLVPQDRYSKSCFICEQQHHESKASIGACMQCNKSGCKQYFHVTCAQAAGLLCEEAGNFLDNVKYCGYCPYHYQKLQKRDSHIKIIPAFKPIPAECNSREGSPERKPTRARIKGGSSMSTERRGCSRPPCNGQVSSDGGASSDATEPRNGATSGGSSPLPSTGTPSTPLPQLPGKFTTANFTEATVVQTGSPVFGERQRKRGRPLGSTKEAKAQQAAQQAAAAAAAAAQAAQQVAAAAAQQTTAAQQQQQQQSQQQQPQQQQQSPQQQLQQQPVPLLQAKTEPLSPPPSSLASNNPTPSFSSIYENLVGSSRHSEKRPKAKRPSPSQGGSSRASPSSSGERETAKNGSLGGGKRCASASGGPRLRKKVPPMLSPSAQTAAASAATNGLPPVMGSGDIDHTYYRPKPKENKKACNSDVRELSLGGEEGSRPASADSVLTQPARLESDDATLESSNIQGKMPQPPEDHDDKNGRVSATLPPEGWASTCQVGPPRMSMSRSPAWPESAAVPSLIPQTLEQLLERQWDQGSGFLMRQAQHFDIASLLSCLHQLRSENMELESRISGLQARRDQLLAVSARLMGPLREGVAPPLVPTSSSPMPLVSHASAAEVNAAAAMSFGTRANLPTSSVGSSVEKHTGVSLGFPLGFPSSAQPSTDHQPHQANELSAASQHGFPGRPAMGHPEGMPSNENSSHRGSTLSTSRQPSNS